MDEWIRTCSHLSRLLTIIQVIHHYSQFIQYSIFWIGTVSNWLLRSFVLNRYPTVTLLTSKTTIFSAFWLRVRYTRRSRIFDPVRAVRTAASLCPISSGKDTGWGWAMKTAFQKQLHVWTLSLLPSWLVTKSFGKFLPPPSISCHAVTHMSANPLHRINSCALYLRYFCCSDYEN